MPLRHNNQAGNSASADMNEPNTIKSISRSRKQVVLRNNSGQWQVLVCDGVTTWVNVSGDYYDPQFSVRAINMCDANNTNAVVRYDMIGDGDLYKASRDTYSTDITERFNTNTLIPIGLTRLYFSGTTATEIHLHG